MHMFGSVSEPQATVESLLATVKDLKRIVDLLLGHTAGGSMRYARVFVQRSEPNEASERDLWIRQALLAGESHTLSFYLGGKWVVFGTGP